jgi:hypothetical protein
MSLYIGKAKRVELSDRQLPVWDHVHGGVHDMTKDEARWHFALTRTRPTRRRVLGSGTDYSYLMGHATSCAALGLRRLAN